MPRADISALTTTSGLNNFISWYPDKGCSESPSCLQCPLEVCKYDLPVQARTFKKERARMVEIRALRASGAKISVLAAQFGMNDRSIYRILGLAKETA